jgi:hypothetical protein
MIRWFMKNVQSFLKDGRTLGQKKRYIREYYPGLYRELYER